MDSSPAYLGRNECSFDRKKQLNYIDKALAKFSKNSDEQEPSQRVKPSVDAESKSPSKLPYLYKRKNIHDFEETKSIELPKQIIIKMEPEQKRQSSRNKVAKTETT